MPLHLTDEQLEKLHIWLTKMEMNVQKLHCKYADAVPLALLIKKLYPRLVDVHSYPPRSSMQLKLDNWELINEKVLAKLNITQSKFMLEKYASATPGAIEILLFDIMLLEKNRQKNMSREVQLHDQCWSENNNVVVINVNKKADDGFVPVAQKMIMYSIYEQVEHDSMVKDSYLSAAQKKIAKLENIIQLKSECFDELYDKVMKLSKQQNMENNISSSQQQLDELEMSNSIEQNMENKISSSQQQPDELEMSNSIEQTAENEVESEVENEIENEIENDVPEINIISNKF